MARVILLSGKQGSGKTTTGLALEKGLRSAGLGLLRCRFAGPVYLAHDAVYAALRPLGVLPDTKKDGKLLQLLGTEWGRSIDPDIWVKHGQAHVAQTDARFQGSKVKTVYLFEDTRFFNEFHSFPGALTVRLECPEEVRKVRTDGWRNNTTHPSETELDGYVADGKFNLVFRTDKQPIEEVVEKIVGRCKELWLGS